jgi:hypothetical protein
VYGYRLFVFVSNPILRFIWFFGVSLYVGVAFFAAPQDWLWGTLLLVFCLFFIC